MVQIINPTKVGLPEGEEGFDLDLLIGNLQKFNDLMPMITQANSTFNASKTDARASRFFRIAVGNVGIIVANINLQFADTYSVAVPANTAEPIAFNAGIIPANMRPKQQVGLVQGPVFSNESRGDNLQAYIAPTGIIGIRSVGSGFTRASSGALVMRWDLVYEWDGVS